MSVLDKIKKLKESQKASGGNFGTTKGIFHQLKEGDSVIRLIGEPFKVVTHFIAPSKQGKKTSRGACKPDAFNGDDRLKSTINCPDWDMDKEEFRKDRQCPICKLQDLAYAGLREKPTGEDKDYLESLRDNVKKSIRYKWNILDRDDPYVIEENDGVEKKVLGMKIATIGPEAFEAITQIFDQMGCDITDVNDGIDIKITRTDGARTSYSAMAVMHGKTVKETPLTAEERALKLHDLKAICGKPIEPSKIIAGLHDDYRQLLETVDSGEAVDDVAAAIDDVVEEKPAAKPAATAAPKAAKPVERAPVVADDDEDPLGDEDTPF